jgi:hypothetical protein
MSANELPVKPHRGQLVDARLHLLDRQLLDDDDDPVGIVDDLELSGVELGQCVGEGSEAPQVRGLLSGRVVALQPPADGTSDQSANAVVVSRLRAPRRHLTVRARPAAALAASRHVPGRLGGRGTRLR